jgi:hypothetical protein
VYKATKSSETLWLLTQADNGESEGAYRWVRLNHEVASYDSWNPTIKGGVPTMMIYLGKLEVTEGCE